MSRQEERIHREIWQFIEAFVRDDVVVFHCPNGEVRSKLVGAKLKAMGVVPGVPDLVILHDGKFSFLELKAAKGTLSQSQQEFAAKAADAGMHSYFVARSLLEAAEYLSTIGVLKK